MRRLAALAVVALVAGLVPLAARVPAAEAADQTFVVKSSLDRPNVNIGDGKCDDDLALNRGSCTLRAAIQEANFTRARDEIVFAVPTIVGRPVTTIRPASPLPSITHRLGLYGYTQRPCATTPAPCSRPNALATATDEQGNTLEISVPRGVVAG